MNNFNMDFKNMMKKNVDNIKSKLPPMPEMPKFKSRKIFNLNRSKENVTTTTTNTLQVPIPSQLQLQLQSQPQSPAIYQSPISIINRSPARISTISSLVERGPQQQINNYNIHDEYPNTNSPINHQNRRIRFEQQNQEQLSKSTTGRLTDRLTKQYKDLSEFRFRHIFGKKTIVRKTEIEVDLYTQRYKDDLEAETETESNQERKMSTTNSDFEFEFQSLPPGGNDTNKKNLNIAIINTSNQPTPLNLPQSISAPSILPLSVPVSVPIVKNRSSNDDLDEILSESTPPPLSRRKVFVKNEKSGVIDEFNSEQQSKIIQTKSSDSGNSSARGSIKSRTSQKSRGMWQVRRATRVLVTKNDTTEKTDKSDNIKKSFTNIFKKFSSLSSIDEPSGTDPAIIKSPKTTRLWQQRSSTTRSSTGDIQPGNPDQAPTDSELKKQFNKLYDKSLKIKNLIVKESEVPSSSSNENIQKSESEDPAKNKSMEEIEGLGYGRKNLKYIEMWKVRRRREIRRNEPFPAQKSDNDDNTNEAVTHKIPGMWKLRRPIRVKIDEQFDSKESQKEVQTTQIAELKKSLANMIKGSTQSISSTNNSDQTNNNPTIKRDSIWKRRVNKKNEADNNPDNDDGNNTDIVTKSTTGKKRSWKISNMTSKDCANNTDENSSNKDIKETDNRSAFWKKISLKTRSFQHENSQDNNNATISGNSGNTGSQILEKAKQRMTTHLERLNIVKSRSTLPKDLPDIANTLSYNNDYQSSNKKNQYADQIQSNNQSDDDELGIEEIEPISIDNMWHTHKLVSSYSTDSDEDSVTNSGFLMQENISVQFGDNEPAIIIVSNAVPSILQYPPAVPKRAFPTNFHSSKLIAPIPLPMHLELPAIAAFPTPPPHKCQVPSPPSLKYRQSPSPPKNPPPAIPVTPLPPESPKTCIPSSSCSSSSSAASLTLPPILSESSKISTEMPISIVPPIISPEPTLIINNQNDNNIIDSPQSMKSKHIRQPSLDVTDTDAWIPENPSICSPLNLNQIEETFEPWSSMNQNQQKIENLESEQLKKWKSVDIFNSQESAFEDFDDALKYEPIFPISTATTNKETINNNYYPTITVPPTTTSTTTATNTMNVLSKSDLEMKPPTAIGVPISIDKPKVSRPVVKQASLRRQFSEEKDAEDLNKKRNVNKMISRFDPERGSSRRHIKHDKIQVIAVIETKIENNNNNNDTIEIDNMSSLYNQENRLQKFGEASSMDVEMDLHDSQSICGFTTEEDSSDGSEFNIHSTFIDSSTKQIITNLDISNNTIKGIQSNNLQDENILLNNNNNYYYDVSQEKIDTKTKFQMIPPIAKKKIADSRKQSEDTFYSFDAADEDGSSTITDYSLGDGKTIIKELYSINM